MDLFAQEEAETAEVAPAGLSADAAEQLLDTVMTAAGRRAALKLLDTDVRRTLTDAVALVAIEKRRAYDVAGSGAAPDAFGWQVKRPALALASSLLAQHFVDNAYVPMAAR